MTDPPPAATACRAGSNRMDIRHGIPVSPGVAIGPALVLDTEGYRIPARKVAPSEADSEVARLRQALAAAARDSRVQRQTVDEQLGRKYGAIFEAHALLLEDPSLIAEVEALIREQAFAAEYAVSRVIRGYAKAFESLKAGPSLATRAADLY